MRKYSKQREAIENYMRGRMDHPTAEQVYESLKITHPELSRGTVYRNLNLLTDDGILVRISPGDGIDRFDPKTEVHAHIICNRCHRLLDLDVDCQSRLCDEAVKKTGAHITGADIIFHGECGQCAQSPVHMIK